VNVKEELRGLSPDEIEEKLVFLAIHAEKDADKLKALELLAKMKGIIKHGSAKPEKDFVEVVIGSHTTKEERDARDAGGKR